MKNLMGLNILVDRRLNFPAGLRDGVPVNRGIRQIES